MQRYTLGYIQGVTICLIYTFLIVLMQRQSQNNCFEALMDSSLLELRFEVTWSSLHVTPSPFCKGSTLKVESCKKLRCRFRSWYVTWYYLITFSPPSLRESIQASTLQEGHITSRNNVPTNPASCCFLRHKHRRDSCWSDEDGIIQWYRTEVSIMAFFILVKLAVNPSHRTAENFRQLCTGEYRYRLT